MKLPTLELVLLALGVGSNAQWKLIEESQTRVVYRPNDPAAQRKIFTYGPLVLPSAAMPAGGSLDVKGAGGGQYMNLPCSAAQPCTILAGRIKLKAEYKNGTSTKPPYIHHFVTSVRGKDVANPITECGRASTSNAFIDAGEDSGDTDTVFTSKDGKRDTGFHLSSPSLRMQYDLVNRENSMLNVFLDLEIEWIKGIKGADSAHALKSVGPCSLPVGGINLKSNEPGANGDAWTHGSPMKINQDSTILWARGHLHKGGKEVQLKVNDVVKCSSKAVYVGSGDTERLTTMEICDAIELSKGDKVSISSLYNINEHPLRLSSDGKPAHGVAGSDVMGMMAISYALGHPAVIKT